MGYILILFGLGLLYYKRRRSFNRRNMAGVEEFKSFEHSVGNRTLEIAMKIIAYILILVGIVQIFNSKPDKINTEIKTQIEKPKK